MHDESLLYQFKDGIGVITINRLKVMNAIDYKSITMLSSLLDEITDTNIRCLIITGAGEKSFVAGADIKEMKDMNRSQGENLSRAGNGVMRKIELFQVPVIAAINGYALGGGLELALACDIRIASQNASFAMPESTFGIIPGYGGIQRLSRIIGQGRAREMIFTTRRFGAEEALPWGLVNAVYPLAELMPSAMDLAGRIASNAPIAIMSAKKIMNESVGLELSAADQLEREAFGNCFGTWDQREAMQAFVEKRKHGAFRG
ncbi:MAG: enoyl-CoA hydratase-related protein [Planctomycetaceae bacterium]|nr:enoyl-CoA hydratase-related protein [Planctomycetaceae bacterium]